MAETLYLQGDSCARLEAGALSIEDRSVPVEAIDGLVLVEPARATSPLLMAMADAGRPVTWLDDSGRLRARLAPVPDGSLDRLLAQVEAWQAPSRRMELARAFVAGRFQSAARSLRRGVREGRDRAPLEAAIAALQVAGLAAGQAEDASALLSAEAAGSQAYWQAFGSLVTTPAFVWKGRSRRPAPDGLNAAISFLSVVWTVRCEGALSAHGLDPRLGFSHVPRPGRASLACDLVEPFRAYGPEREVLALVNRGQLLPSHFASSGQGGVRLTAEGRSIVLSAHHRRLCERVQPPYRSTPVPIALLPALEAERLAAALARQEPFHPWSPR